MRHLDRRPGRWEGRLWWLAFGLAVAGLWWWLPPAPEVHGAAGPVATVVGASPATA